MTEERTQPSASTQILLQGALCFALLGAVGGMVYQLLAKNSPVTSAAVAKEAVSEMVGKLEVSYMVITSKTASSEQSGGGTILASRVQYFPNYVLVTRNDNVTVLWTMERLKKLEVKQMD